EEILDYSYYLVDNMHAYFVVNNLSYLVKNGRLSGAAGFVGNLLRIKPVLEITKDGRIVSKMKVKTYRKAVDTAIEMFVKELEGVKEAKILVFHSLMDEKAIELQKFFTEKFKFKNSVEIHMITPAVGAHIGSGIIGFGYFILER
ncbi:MAG TPA: DegV family EDD domain-containing protein, partial [Acholeplasmataceae bacterium]|nr:DegV family EDD domain-containing protein [Acholeplasmataceae bacterium]